MAGAPRVKIPVKDNEGNVILVIRVPQRHVNLVRAIIPKVVSREMAALLKEYIESVMKLVDMPSGSDTEERQRLCDHIRKLGQDLGVLGKGKTVAGFWEQLKTNAEEFLAKNGLRKAIACPSCGQIIAVNLTYFAWFLRNNPEGLEELLGHIQGIDAIVEGLPFPFLRDKMIVCFSPELKEWVLRLHRRYNVPKEELLRMVMDILRIGELKAEEYLGEE